MSDSSWQSLTACAILKIYGLLPESWLAVLLTFLQAVHIMFYLKKECCLLGISPHDNNQINVTQNINVEKEVLFHNGIEYALQ